MVELFPTEHDAKPEDVIHTAEFRALDTLADQIIYIREHTESLFPASTLLPGRPPIKAAPLLSSRHSE